MEIRELFERLFLKNWPRKLTALISALCIWFLVSQSLTMSRTLVDVPIRIVNLSPDKTVVGLLSNGLLNRHTSLTVTGKKSVIEDLKASDLEIIINAANHKDGWIASISKRNLASLNQDIDLHKHITEAEAHDLFIQLSKLVTEEVPITILKPLGDPPKGYQFLDIWPKCLTQRVSGPEEQVRELKQKGLELIFNLNRITPAELDTLYARRGNDEITFIVPEAWKKIAIPFTDQWEPLNDPRADLLRMDFLKQELVPLSVELPITIFFPTKYSQTINPQTYSLATNEIVQKKYGLKRLTIPLYVRDVSLLFLEVVRDNLLLIVVAAPKNVQASLNWAVEFIDERALEDTFVKSFLSQSDQKYIEESFTKYNEQAIRDRFMKYLRKFVVFTEEGAPLKLKAHLDGNQITLEKELSECLD